MARALLKEHDDSVHTGWHAGFERGFEMLRRGYLRVLDTALKRPLILFAAFGCLIAATVAILPRVGQDFFPSVDAGQMRLHVNAPTGYSASRITGAIFSGGVEDEIRRVVDAERPHDVIHRQCRASRPPTTTQRTATT